MAYSIQIKFGTEWQNYEGTISDLVITEVLHNNLKPADASCTFSLVPNIALFNLLRGIDTANIQARVLQNSTILFSGYIRKTFEFKKTQRLQPVKVELVSPSFILKKKITSEFRYTNTSLNTIIIALLNACGITNYDIPDFNITVPVFLATLEESYHDVLATLLFEYGYVFYFNNEGQFKVYRYYPDSLSTIKEFNGTNCIDEISQTKKEERKEKIIVKWYEIKDLSNVIVFSDTTNAKDGYKCYITLPPQQYLGGKEEWFAEFNHEEGEIIFASGINLSIDKGQYIQVLKFEQRGNRALLSIKNTSTLYDDRILKLDITASTVKVKKNINTSIVQRSATPNDAEEIETKYIFSKTYADALANYLSWYHKYCDYTYNLKSKTNYAIGDLVIISEYGLGSITARITKRTIKLQTGVIEYELEGVSEYTPVTADGGSYIENRIPAQTLDNLYNQIDGINQTLAGQNRDQTIPLNPLALEAKAYIDGIYIRIIPADSGTLLQQAVKYRIQRSTDEGSTWYDINGVLNGSATIENSQYFWQFNRSVDGYPEASGNPEPWPPLSSYRFRIKAVNSIGTEAPDWLYISSVDTSQYGTWLPPQPTVGGGISAMREVRAMVDPPANVFGIIGYDIQISKDQVNWYKPALGLDVYASEENFKQGNIGEWRRISVPQWTQSVPLENQATDPQATTYYFRFRIVTDRIFASGTPSGYSNSVGKTAGPWSSVIPVIATPTSAYDVIKARKADGTMQPGALGVEKIYAENLAAITGNLSVLSGGQEDPYNYWSLSDYPGRPSDRPVGKFRVGTEDVYLFSNPQASGTEQDPYIEIRGKNNQYIKVTSQGIIFSDAWASTFASNSAFIESLLSKSLQIQSGGHLRSGGYNASGSNPSGDPGVYLSGGGTSHLTKAILHNSKVDVTYNGGWTFNSISGATSIKTLPRQYAHFQHNVFELSNGDLILIGHTTGTNNNYMGVELRKSNGIWGDWVTLYDNTPYYVISSIKAQSDEIYTVCIQLTNYQYQYKVILRKRASNGVWNTYDTDYTINTESEGVGILGEYPIPSYISGEYIYFIVNFSNINGRFVREYRIKLSDYSCEYVQTLNLHTNEFRLYSITNINNEKYLATVWVKNQFIGISIRDVNGAWGTLTQVATNANNSALAGSATYMPDDRTIIFYAKDYSNELAYRIRSSDGSLSSEQSVYTYPAGPRISASCMSGAKVALLVANPQYNSDHKLYETLSTSYYTSVPKGIIPSDIGAGIVEVGQNSNGTWIKFSDGTMIEYGKINLGTDIPFNYPMLFIATPSVMAGVFSEQGDNGVPPDWMYTVSGNQGSSSHTTFRGKIFTGSALMNFSSAPQGYIQIKWLAIGRWK